MKRTTQALVGLVLGTCIYIGQSRYYSEVQNLQKQKMDSISVAQKQLHEFDSLKREAIQRKGWNEPMDYHTDDSLRRQYDLNDPTYEKDPDVENDDEWSGYYN